MFEEIEAENTGYHYHHKTLTKEEIKQRYQDIQNEIKDDLKTQIVTLAKCFEYECLCYSPFLPRTASPLTGEYLSTLRPEGAECEDFVPCFDVDILDKIKSSTLTATAREQYIQLLCWGYATLVKLEEQDEFIRMTTEEVILRKLGINVTDCLITTSSTSEAERGLVSDCLLVHDDVMKKVEYMYYKILNKRDELYFMIM